MHCQGLPKTDFILAGWILHAVLVESALLNPYCYFLVYSQFPHIRSVFLPAGRKEIYTKRFTSRHPGHDVGRLKSPLSFGITKGIVFPPVRERWLRTKTLLEQSRPIRRQLHGCLGVFILVRSRCLYRAKTLERLSHFYDEELLFQHFAFPVVALPDAALSGGSP